MKQRIFILNNISGISFLISSLTLIGIPFLNLKNGFSVIAYLLAGLFWTGLLAGVILQIITAQMSKKIKSRKRKTHKERRMIIPFSVFFLIFLLILVFLKESVVLMSIDLACMLFSIEMFFYMKRRYNI